MKKHSVINQLILFNILIFIFGIYSTNYVLNNDILNIKRENYDFALAMGIVITLLINLMSLVMVSFIQNNLFLIDEISTLNKNLKETQRIGKLYGWEYNLINKKTIISDEMLNTLNINKKDFSLINILKNVYKKDRKIFIKAIKNIIKNNQNQNFMFRYKINNEIKWFFSETKIENSNKENIIFGILQDLTELYQKEENLNSLGNILDDSLNEIQIIDLENLKFLHVNKQSLKNLGYSKEEILGMNIGNILTEYVNKESFINYLNPIIEKISNSIILNSLQKRKNGEVYPVEVNFFKSRFKNKDVLVAITLDVTEKNKTQNQLKYLAYNDVLTNIYNRTYIFEYIKNNIDKNKNFSVLLLDLDKFKSVNDNLGHIVGDELLKNIAHELKEIIGNKNKIARIGGDEFLVVIESTTIKKHVYDICTKIIDRMINHFSISQNDLYISTSIGLVFYPEQAKSFNDLILNADLAMYYAKNNGGNKFLEFSDEIALISKEKIKIENDLKLSASNSNEIVAYFQPQLCLKTNKIIGGEALARWILPNNEIIMPSKFIKIAEESNLIKEIGINILRQSCRFAVMMSNLKKEDFRLAVNLSGKQLMSDLEINKIIQVVTEEKCNPKYIELEITEGILMEPSQELINRLFLLKEKGFKLALDDFGTGYSSLSYINKFPLDFLKIDASFIKKMKTDETSKAIVKTIINLAKGLNLKTIAEGVETKEELDFLKENGCDYIQGFLIDKALTKSDFLLKINKIIDI